ncbi:MAG: hypothetical protein V4578_18245, partial [Pseudomonadota bacterium]
MQRLWGQCGCGHHNKSGIVAGPDLRAFTPARAGCRDPVFTRIYLVLTALYTPQPENGGSKVQSRTANMNIKKPNLHGLLLAAMLALPLVANADMAALADGAGGAAPGFGHPPAPGLEDGRPMRGMPPGPEAMHGGVAMPGMMPFG